jgi:hypothetical protein
LERLEDFHPAISEGFRDPLVQRELGADRKKITETSCSDMVLSAGLMGHSSGQTERRHLGLWIALHVLVSLVLFEIIDFDRPRRGLIRMNHAPLIELQKTLH